QKAEQFTMSFQDDTGLLDDDLGACLHDIGYTECAHTTEINVEAYTSLLAAAQLADLVGQPDQAATWRAEAATLRTTINDLLYDPLRGAYLQALEDPGIISQTGTALADYWGI